MDLRHDLRIIRFSFFFCYSVHNEEIRLTTKLENNNTIESLTDQNSIVLIVILEYT